MKSHWMFYLFLVACGTHQPVKEIPPPQPVLPTSGVCLGAQGGGNVQVTLAMGESNYPEIVWEKDHFRIAWWDLRSTTATIYHIGMDKNGFEVFPPTKLFSQGAAKNQTMAFDGNETHITWTEGNQVVSARLTQGEPGMSILTDSGTGPTAGAWGAAVWIDGGRIFFQSDGMTPGITGQVEPKVISAGGVDAPKIAYNGAYFAVVWSASAPGGRDIIFQRVSPKGNLVGEPIKLSTVKALAKSPAVTFDGKNFFVGWTAVAKGLGSVRERYQISVAAVPQVGNRSLFSKELSFRSTDPQVAVAAAGKEYAVAWVGNKGKSGNTILFQRLTLKGELKGGTVDLIDGEPLICSRPDMAWDGNGYAVVWHDDRAGVDTEVFFTYLQCGDEETEAPDTDPGTEKTDEGEKDGEGGPALKDVF